MNGKIFGGLALFLAFVISGLARAVAGPPYETDDPEPTAYRNYEIYAYGDYQHNGDVDAIPFALEFNYGLAPNVQFSVTLPERYQSGVDTTGNATSANGFGDIEVALKYRFLRETSTRPQIAFYPSVALATSRADGQPDGGHGTLFLPLWAQKTNGKWTFFGGGGALLDWDGTSRTSWFGGLAATYDVTTTTNAGVEIARSTAHNDLPGATDIGVGIIHDVGTVHAVLASVGRSLSPGTFHAYAAYEWRLGPREPSRP